MVLLPLGDRRLQPGGKIAVEFYPVASRPTPPRDVGWSRAPSATMEAEAAAWRQEAQTTQAVCSDPKIYAMQLAMLQPEVPSSLLGAAAASFQRSWYESVVL